MSIFKVLNCKAGTYITIAGRSLEFFYIIQAGQVASVATGTNRETLLNPGDFFGLESCLSSSLYDQEDYAVTDVQLICVQRGDVLLLFQNVPSIGIKIMNYFSYSLRAMGDQEMALLTTQKAKPPNSAVLDEETESLFNAGTYFSQVPEGGNSAFQYFSLLQEKFLDKLTQVQKDKVEKALASLSKVGFTQNAPYPNTLTSLTLPPHTHVFGEGETGKHLFLIDSGSVEIYRFNGSKKIVIEKLREGSVFGEMALLESKPRSAGAVIAEDETRLTIVPQGEFEELIKGTPKLGVRLTALFADRVGDAKKRVRNRGIVNKTTRLYDMILIELQRHKIDFDAPVAYAIELTPKELFAMAGLTEQEGSTIARSIAVETRMDFKKDEIYVPNVKDFRRVSTKYLNKLTKTKT